MTVKKSESHQQKAKPKSTSSIRLPAPPQARPSLPEQLPLNPLIQRASQNPTALTSQEVSQLQRTIGNRAVGQLVGRREQAAGEGHLTVSQMMANRPFLTPTPFIQRAIGTEGDGKLVERKKDGKRFRASQTSADTTGKVGYKLTGEGEIIEGVTHDNDDYDLIGDDVMEEVVLSSSDEKKEALSTNPKKRKEFEFKRKESKLKKSKTETVKKELDEDSTSETEFEYDSEEEDNILTVSEKFGILTDMEKKRQPSRGKKMVEKKDDIFSLHHPKSRKNYGAHRVDPKSHLSNLSMQELFLIGEQTHRMGEGRGHFVQPGGNKRPEKVKEPDADYDKLFENIKKLGATKEAISLYKLAKGIDEDPPSWGDVETATIALHYINNDAQEIEKKLGERTQLTENLSKLAAITGVAEWNRGLESKKDGESAPYDATLLIKQTLKYVAEGKATLKEGFYKGTGGQKSIFMGASNKDKNPDKFGGATVLRDPFNPKYKEYFERQMNIFPEKKGEFVDSLNALKNQSSIKLIELTDEDRDRLEKKSIVQNQIKQAAELADAIWSERIATKAFDIEAEKERVQKNLVHWKKLVAEYESEFKDNAEAIEELKTAKEGIKELKKMVGTL